MKRAATAAARRLCRPCPPARRRSTPSRPTKHDDKGCFAPPVIKSIRTGPLQGCGQEIQGQRQGRPPIWRESPRKGGMGPVPMPPNRKEKSATRTRKKWRGFSRTCKRAIRVPRLPKFQSVAWAGSHNAGPLFHPNGRWHESPVNNTLGGGQNFAQEGCLRRAPQTPTHSCVFRSPRLLMGVSPPFECQTGAISG